MLEKIFEAARELADELSADIQKCSTRTEHVRVTARANAAADLVDMLARLDDDLK